MKCNNASCTSSATRIMGLPTLSQTAVFVAPYCDRHTQEVKEMGAVPVSGPALSASAREIEGIRDA